MATKTVVCPECGTPLPYGRLSCPACGTLVASVAGTRRVTPLQAAELPEEPRTLDDPEAPPAEGPVGAAELAEARPLDAEARTWTVPPVLGDWSDEPPAPEPDDDAPLEREPEPAAAAGAPAAHRTETLPAPTVEPDIPFLAAGAYLPPSALFASPVGDVPPATPATRRVPKPVRAGQASLLADLPFDAPDDLPGWFVAIGSGLAMVAFLVPWGPSIIGSAGAGGWLDTWGLGAPMHLPIFAAVVVTLVLAVLPGPVAGWIRAGVLPLVLGGLLLGLIWPYLVGPLRGQFGSVGVAVGGILLLVGGVLEIAGRRHAQDVPDVPVRT